MYGGDDIGALVCDIGSSYTSMGVAGEDTPRVYLPSAYGHIPTTTSTTMKMEDTPMLSTEETGGTPTGTVPTLTTPKTTATTGKEKERIIGERGLLYRRTEMEVVPVLNEQGWLGDVDVCLEVLQYGLQEIEGKFMAPRRDIRCEHPILLSEANDTPKEIREKIAEMLFELMLEGSEGLFSNSLSWSLGGVY